MAKIAGGAQTQGGMDGVGVVEDGRRGRGRRTDDVGVGGGEKAVMLAGEQRDESEEEETRPVVKLGRHQTTHRCHSTAWHSLARNKPHACLLPPRIKTLISMYPTR